MPCSFLLPNGHSDPCDRCLSIVQVGTAHAEPATGFECEEAEEDEGDEDKDAIYISNVLTLDEHL